IHWFETLTEARQVIEAWRRDYNESGPHMALGNLAPAEFALRERDNYVSIEKSVVGN
ncbi:MAG: integrase core domain-containing protein, partial [Pseudomonadota bacterium]